MKALSLAEEFVHLCSLSIPTPNIYLYSNPHVKETKPNREFRVLELRCRLKMRLNRVESETNLGEMDA